MKPPLLPSTRQAPEVPSLLGFDKCMLRNVTRSMEPGTCRGSPGEVAFSLRRAFRRLKRYQDLKEEKLLSRFQYNKPQLASILKS